MPPKERPPPEPDQGDGLDNERLPEQLLNRFNDYAARSQGVTPVLPRQRLAYLTRAIHRLGERGAELSTTLERYAALPADLILALDGDRLFIARPVPEGGGRDVA